MIPEEVAEIISPVAFAEAIVNSLFVVSQPNPDVSDVIDPEPLKKAICPLVPDPAIPPDPTVHVTSWFEPFRQIVVPVLFVKPVKFIAPAIVVVSLALPMLMVSAVVLSVAILIVLPAVPVPKLIVLALLPVPRFRVFDPVVSIVPAAAKVRAVGVVVIVSRLATPLRTPPVVTLRPPLEDIWKVPLLLPMLVPAVPVLFILVVPVTVNPPVPCMSPLWEFTPTEVIDELRVSAPLDVTTQFAPFI